MKSSGHAICDPSSSSLRSNPHEKTPIHLYHEMRYVKSYPRQAASLLVVLPANFTHTRRGGTTTAPIAVPWPAIRLYSVSARGLILKHVARPQRETRSVYLRCSQVATLYYRPLIHAVNYRNTLSVVITPPSLY